MTNATDKRPETPRAHRFALPACAAALAVALLIWIVEACLAPDLVLQQARGSRDWRQISPDLLTTGDFLLLTMTSNAAILAWAIWLDGRMKAACQTCRSAQAHDERWLLAIPAILAVGTVTVWANSLAERAGLANSLPMTIGVVLPTLSMTALLLWRSALALKRSATRAALLGGYVLTVAGLELWLRGGPRSGGEDLMIAGHSLLIGLAVGVRLAVWYATESPSAAREAA